MEGGSRKGFGKYISNLSLGSNVEYLDIFGLDLLPKVRDPGCDMFHTFGRGIVLRH